MKRMKMFNVFFIDAWIWNIETRPSNFKKGKKRIVEELNHYCIQYIVYIVYICGNATMKSPVKLLYTNKKLFKKMRKDQDQGVNDTI
jgi:hypothetical protein